MWCCCCLFLFPHVFFDTRPSFCLLGLFLLDVFLQWRQLKEQQKGSARQGKRRQRGEKEEGPRAGRLQVAVGRVVVVATLRYPSYSPFPLRFFFQFLRRRALGDAAALDKALRIPKKKVSKASVSDSVFFIVCPPGLYHSLYNLPIFWVSAVVLIGRNTRARQIRQGPGTRPSIGGVAARRPMGKEEGGHRGCTTRRPNRPLWQASALIRACRPAHTP